MPTSRQRRSLALLAAGAALTLGVTGALDASAAPGSSGRNPNTDAVAQTGVDSSSAVVGLSRDPLATDPRTAPGKGRKIDFTSTAVKSERALLVDQRNTFKQWLKKNAPSAKVTGEYDVALNAVAVRLNGTALSTLRSGPGVTSVGYQGSYSPTADDPDLSLIDAMAGWAAAGNSAVGRQGRRGGQRRARGQGRRGRHRHRRRAPLLRRGRLPGDRAGRQPRLHQQQGDRRPGVREQGGQPRVRREGRPGPRHPRRRHDRLRRAHAGQHRRRRHHLRPERRRPRGAAGQLQRVPRRHHQRPQRGHPRRARRRRPRTGWTSST